ncbi:MAG: MFS transporter [Thermoproteota archaeon]|nr:MFS transporter [Candidatus Brockarchaeota archaeon]
MLKKSAELEGVITGGTIYQTAYSMQASIASPFFNNRGFSPSQIGLLNSVSWGIIGFASMPCGRLSDATTRRLPLILSSILGMVACILVYWVTNSFTVFFLYVLLGFSIAFFTPNTSALIFERVEPRRAPVFFAVFYLATLIGASIGSFLSGWLSKNFMSESPFLIASLFFLASIPVYIAFIRNVKRPGGNELQVLARSFNIKAMARMLRQNKRLCFYGFSLFFHELGFFMINPYVSLFAQKVVGLDIAGVGMVAATWNIGAALGFLPWAWVSSKKGSWRVLLAHLLISSPAWAILALSNSLWTMLLYIFIFGFVGAMDLPARRTLTAELCRGENLGEAMGFIELSNGLSGMLGGAMGGFFWELFGPASIFYASSILTLASAPFLYLTVKDAA